MYRLFSRLHFFIHFLLILFFSNLTSAQENDAYTLLWKIEGKDSKAPSYLFGTMHVDDARAFKFSDAVMPAIESSKYFALEINPDSMMVAYLSKEYKKPAYQFFKNLLKSKDYKRLLKRFEEVNEISLEDSEIMDPDLVLSMLIPDEDKEDDKSAFVDLYLLGHAKTMNREITGLEDLDDQLNYFDRLPKEEQISQTLDALKISADSISSTKNIMTEIYQTGDLSKIKDFIEQYDNPYDANFISRNKVMCNSIIDIMKEGSVFSAIGAAHLVGDQSVIAMLQNRGYTVTKVNAKFTGVADTYKIDTSKGLWFPYIDEDLGYSLEMPKAPNLKEDFDKFIIYGYSDLSTKTNYMFMGYDTGFNFTETQNEVLIDKMISNIIEKREGKIIDKERLPDTDKIAYNITSTLPDNTVMKSRFAVKNNHFYYFSAETLEDQINEPYISRFINSITIKGVEKKATDNTDNNWKTYTSKKGAFSINIPVEEKDLSRESPNPYEPEGTPYYLNLYMAMDTNNNNNYIFRYNDQPPGYYMQSAEVAFEETKASLTQKADLLKEPKVIYLGDMEGREYELNISSKYHTIVRAYFRGNRTYLLLKQKLNNTEKVTTDDGFFDSFKLLPYQETKLETYQSPKKDFKIKLFNNTRETIDSLDFDDSNVKDTNDYFSFNPNTGGVYQYSYSNIDKYFRLTSYKKLLESYRDADLEYTDSIISQRFYKKNNDSIIEYIVKNKTALNTDSQKITKIWFNNNRVQMAKAIFSDEEAKSETFENVFNSINVKTVKSKFNIFESKAKHIIEDLKSKDSLIYKKALSAFDYYEFDTGDFPILYKALNYAFSDEKNDAIKLKIINEFSLASDENTLSEIEAFYNKTNTSDTLKSALLVAIPGVKSEKSLALHKKLLFNNPPEEKKAYEYNIFRPYLDSLSYALEDYDNLLKLISYEQYREDVIDIAVSINKAKLDTTGYLEKRYDKIIAYIKNDSEAYLKQTETEREENYTYKGIILSYLNLMNSLKSNSDIVESFTAQLLESETDKWIKLLTVTARIYNNLPVSKSILDASLEDYYTRFETMDALNKQSKLNQVDRKYLTPEEFAKLSFYNYAGENNSYPDKMEILKEITKENKTFYAIKFDYNTEEDNKESYIGIVGPVSDITKNETFEMFYSSSYWNSYDDTWEAKCNELVTEFLYD